MSMAVLLAALAFVVVAGGVALIIQFDGALAKRGRSPMSAATTLGARARHRVQRKPSLALFLLLSVLSLLVIATLV